jgi:hypothetical protein
VKRRTQNSERGTKERRAAALRLLSFCVLSSAFCVLNSCGYQQQGDYNAQSKNGYKWRSLYREDIQTVAVPIFQNKDFHRNVEFSLTHAIIKDIEATSPYKVVSRETADTILEGEITRVRTATISLDPKSVLPQEQVQQITVDFRWKDLRTGKILVERRAFDQTSPYYPTLGESQFIAQQDAVERLAVGIVQELQADW